LKISSLKSYLWMLVIIFLMFSFPLQVITMSPLPALIPYLFVLLILAINTLDSNIYHRPLLSNKNIKIILIAYSFLFCIHAIWKMIFNFITLEGLVSSIINYIFPLVFYFYFSKYATRKELQSIFIAIIICSIISGFYFVYDSYSMHILGEINEYSTQVIEYNRFRQPNQDDPNISRMTLGYRSHGLLEKHSISAAWISMGCFSLLALLSRNLIKTRISIIMIFFFTLLLSLNYSAIIAFICVIFFIEYKGYLIFKGRFSKIGLKQLIYSIAIFLLFVFITLITWSQLTEVILTYTRFQLGIATGNIVLTYQESTFVGGFIRDMFLYPKNMLKFPPGILIGDGFSKWGVHKDGGDFGLIESLHHLGLPFFAAIIIGLFRSIKLALINIYNGLWEDKKWRSYINFTVCFVLYLFITSIHYTTWSAKSIFPIFMISIAIISRYRLFVRN